MPRNAHYFLKKIAPCDHCQGAGLIKNPVWDLFYAEMLAENPLHIITIDDKEAWAEKRGYGGIHGMGEPSVTCPVCKGENRLSAEENLIEALIDLDLLDCDDGKPQAPGYVHDRLEALLKRIEVWKPRSTNGAAVMAQLKIIYCCGCQGEIIARLTNGKEIYPRRRDLATLPFWKCDLCGNYVGCHHKTKERTRPLGNIPTPALREARKAIHAVLDPLFGHDKSARKGIYKAISERLGHEYHTANIKTLEEANSVLAIVMGIRHGA